MNAVTAHVQEKLAQAKFWRILACTRHGVPKPDTDVSIDSVIHAAAEKLPPDSSQQIIKYFEEQLAKEDNYRKAVNAFFWKWVAVVLVAMGIGGAGTAGTMWLFGDEEVQTNSDQSGSLLQYLQDQSRHLPGNG